MNLEALSRILVPVALEVAAAAAAAGAEAYARATDELRHLDEHEAAAYLKVKVSTLRGWRGTGDGPQFISRSDGHVRYRYCDLNAWADHHRWWSTSQRTVELKRRAELEAAV
ncbi:MAG: helix-turn-helix domain-containing protein [Acidobacteriota bacterium]